MSGNGETRMINEYRAISMNSSIFIFLVNNAHNAQRRKIYHQEDDDMRGRMYRKRAAEEDMDELCERD